jgi:hypothetical protein
MSTSSNDTGRFFSLDNMVEAEENWIDVLRRISKKLNSLKGRHLSVVSKSNTLNAQLQPIVSFLSSYCEMPATVEKELDALLYNFLWGGSCKETKALTVEPKRDGGLRILHYRSRLDAIHC